ncbi:hypothetical protein D3C84_837930 [compost metagenome]
MAQDVGTDVLGPWAQGIAFIVQYADQAIGDIRGIGGFYIDGRFTDLAGIVQTQVGKISLAAWPAGRLGHMQTQGGVLVHAFLRSLCLVFLLSFEAVAAETPACDQGVSLVLHDIRAPEEYFSQVHCLCSGLRINILYKDKKQVKLSHA